MKLFYDNLLAYMPEIVLNETGGVPNRQLHALREVMKMLSLYQNTGDGSCLYTAVYHLSVFANTSVKALLLSLTDVEVPSGTVDSLLNQVATAIFELSLQLDVEGKFPEFDYKSNAAILLTIAHTLYQIQNGFVKIEEPQNEPEMAEE